jgi:diacylglycerol kinase (ATP)
MRAAAIFGLGCSSKNLLPFQTDNSIEWHIGMPASQEQADVILLFGGDGTIHRHLGQLVQLGLPVLIVPVGSGNDFARAIGLRTMRDSIEAWRRFCLGAGTVRAVDLGVVAPLEDAGRALTAQAAPLANPAQESRYFCCVAGVGLDAEIAERANRLPRWLRGHGGYALSLLPAVLGFRPFPLKIQSANERDSAPETWTVRSHQPTVLAAFANTPFYGGGMKIAPLALMDDGLLDICVVGAVNPIKLLCMFPSVYAGRHLQINQVGYFQAEKVWVETEHPTKIYADGEFVCHTPAEISLRRAALRIVTT